MRSALLGKYGAYVSDMPRVYLRGARQWVKGEDGEPGRMVECRLGTELTTLDQHAAPDLDQLPARIATPMRQEFWQRLGEGNAPEKADAAAWVAQAVRELIDADLAKAFDLDVIEDLAGRAARICGRLAQLEHMQEFCERCGIDPPAPHGARTRVGCRARLRSHRWWRRQFDKALGRRAEDALRRAGIVQRHRDLYASYLTRRQHRAKQKATGRWIRDRVVISDAGDQLELWDVRERSQANPALRRGELMVRLRGFSEVAEAAGHVADFYTLTTPSKFHRTLDHGAPNPNYAGATVRDGQMWLRSMWAKARAKLKRLKVLIYGFRIAEPHHDGTAHWHMVLFTVASHRDTVRRVLRGYWLSEDGDERGAQQRRISIKEIDSAAGNAAGYLAKYVAKNIDGHEVGGDHESSSDADASQTCQWVTAWASRHGVRQFQQIGGPAVTVWRELRRIRTACSVARIESARVHADAGEWAAFIESLGGIEAGRAGAVSLWSEITGEITQYDELRGPQIKGVRSGVLQVETRTKIWRVEKRVSPLFSSLGPVSISVRGAGAPAAWTNPNESSMYGPN
jgi:hypothetical protein